MRVGRGKRAPAGRSRRARSLGRGWSGARCRCCANGGPGARRRQRRRSVAGAARSKCHPSSVGGVRVRAESATDFFFQLPSLPTAYYTPTWSSDKIQKFSRPVSKDQNVSWPPYLTVLIGEGRHTPRWPVEPITTEFRSQLTSIFPFLYAFELLLLSLHTRLQSHVPSEPSVTLSSYLQPAASRCTYWRYCIVVAADATAHSSSDLGEERQVTCQQQL